VRAGDGGEIESLDCIDVIVGTGSEDLRDLQRRHGSRAFRSGGPGDAAVVVTEGDDFPQLFARRGRREEAGEPFPAVASEIVSRGEYPVLHERGLQAVNGRTHHANVGIPPGRFALGANTVIVGDVHPAGEADPPVDDRDLAVGTEVQDSPPEAKKTYPVEEADVDARVAHPAHAGMSQPRGDRVHQEAHLDARARPLLQRLHDPQAGRVISEDVVLEMDMVTRSRDGRHQSVIAVVPIDEEPDLLDVLRRQMPELRARAHELSFERQPLGARLLPLLQQLADPVAGQAEAQLLAPQVLGPDQEVDGHADQRQGGHDRYPGQRRSRGSPLEKNESRDEHDPGHLSDAQQKSPRQGHAGDSRPLWA